MNTCTVCRHPQRAEIDKALVAGEPLRQILSRFVTENVEIGRMALQRHKTCIAATLSKSQKANDEVRADDLLAELKALRKKAYSILLQAERQGDLRTALAGIREARACLELLAELEGELNRNPHINILISPEWVTIRGTIMDALQPYPTARIAVSERLQTVEIAQAAPL